MGGLYTDWNRGEPNNVSGAEACAVIQLKDGTWYDYRCATPEYFDCEAY